MRFKPGDRIIDPESDRYTNHSSGRTGTVRAASRDGKPGDIEWDDGVTFSYSENEFARMKYIYEVPPNIYATTPAPDGEREP